MDAQLFADLERFVSQPRLGRYRSLAESDLDAAVLYCWNIQLAEAVMPALSVFEVALRNAVHNALTAHTQTDWWFPIVLQRQSADNIQDLVYKLTPRNGPRPTSGKVVSEITFGFWQKMFARVYADLWWGNQAPQLLPSVLPNHPNPARDTRNRLEERLEYFLRLRNRAVHHEMIWEGIIPPNRPNLLLDEVYDQLIETLGWIDYDAAALAVSISRFDTIFTVQAQLDIENILKTRYQIP